jgi:hypothetical protein
MDRISWINDLKVRFGYGISGNDNVGNYNIYNTYRSNISESYYNIVGTSHTSSEAGFHQYKLGNPDARWETGITENIGIDASFFNSSLGFSLDFYRRKTTNMLYPSSLPATYGQVVAPSINIGDMLNKGFDLNITYHFNVSRSFTFDVTATASHYKNEVLKLNDNPDEILFGSQLRGDSYTATQAGHPISSFYGYVVEGIFNTQEEVDKWPKYNPDANGNDSYSKPGVLKFKDVNGDGVITADDRTFIGSSIPKLTYGLNINVGYKNWELEIFSQGVYGNKISNFTFWSNFSAFPLERLYTQSWTKERYESGAKITVPMLTRDMTIEHLPSSFFLENGSYFRTKSLKIGYTIPDKVLSSIKIIQGLHIYIQATDLFTITKYTGQDPEIIQISDLTKGVDNSVYPTPKTFILGLHFQF